MPRDILAEATKWHWDQIGENVAEMVHVVQGAAEYDVWATPALDESSQIDDLGVLYSSRQQQFLFKASRMSDLGMRDFCRGDKIIRTLPDGAVVTYEVMTEGSEPVWRFSSRYRIEKRVFTKRVVDASS